MKVFGYLILSITMLVSCGCVTVYNPATQRNEMYFISESYEIDMGKELSEAVRKDNKMIEDPKIVSEVRTIGEDIARICDRPTIAYHFYVVDNEEMNAFALPGGYIFVHKGLLDKTQKDELAFVLAHEIGHVNARHSVKRLQAALGVNLVMSLALGNNAQSMQQALGTIYNVVAKGYSRQDEYLADSLAVKYTHRGGFDPQAGVTLMEKLAKEGAQGHPFVFLSSHPKTSDRIKNIKDKISQIQKNP